MLLSVIIVNYNVKYFLEYCLYSVGKAMQGIAGEIFVVDNNSTDGSKEFFKNIFPEVKFIWNTENEGFAKANNKALQRTCGDYILFLNPDTIVPEDCFKKCISFIQSNGNDIACGIKMIDGSGKFLKESKRAFPSPMTSLYKLSGFTKLFPKSKLFSKYHLGYLDENENHVVDVLAGAFMFIPKKIITKAGGFDESFFMYGEDIDLSYRIQKAGYKNFYFAESSIIHFKGESTIKGSFNYVKMFYKAMSIFVKKHYGGTKAGFFNFSIQAAIFARAGFSAIGGFFKLNVKKNNSGNNEISKILIAGTEEDCKIVSDLLKASSTNEIIGSISNKEIAEPDSLGSFYKVVKILNSHNINNIIICEGGFSFKQVIEALPEIPRTVKVNFFSKNMHAIIGSANQNESGTFILNKQTSV